MHRLIMPFCVGLGLALVGPGQGLAQVGGGTVYTDAPLSADDLESVFGLAPTRSAPETAPKQARTRGLTRSVSVVLGEAPGEAPGAGAASEAPKPQVKSYSVPIQFGLGSDVVDPGARSQLAGLVELLGRRGDLVILVIGHTDDRGLPAANQTLSERRALAVRRLLTTQGVAERQLASMGQGSSRPLPGVAPSGDRQRRVEFVMVPLN